MNVESAPARPRRLRETASAGFRAYGDAARPARGRRSSDLVVLVGARGRVGRLHAEIYRSLGVSLVEVDIAGPTLTSAQLRAIPWSDVVVDVCTPTGTHTKSVRWGYAHGARRFLVEKPAGRTCEDWLSCMGDVKDALIFVGHSYLFSRAFELMVDACPVVAGVSAIFDKDRTADDLRLRGAGEDGRLADIFEIEVPHAFSMALAIEPRLKLASATYTRYGERTPGSLEPTRCEARLTHPALREVLVQSDLRAPCRRVVALHGDDGRRVLGYFAPSSSPPESGVYGVDAQGRMRTLFEGRDDLLRATLVAGLAAMRSGSVPWLASAHFAALVVARIAQARALAAGSES